MSSGDIEANNWQAEKTTMDDAHSSSDSDGPAKMELGTAAPPAPVAPPAITFPEGGSQAWLVAAGSAAVYFCAFGYVNAFGVYQEYYQTHQLAHESPSNISWIGSLQNFFLFGGVFFGGPLFDRYGGKILWPAALLYVFSVMMTSLCKQYWEFMLAQGILGGMMIGFCTAPPMAAVGQYFNKKRGAAMGLVVAGASIGGVIFPIALTKMLYSSIGFGWAVRIVGFIMVPLLLFGCLTVKARLPPRESGFLLPYAFLQPRFLIVVGSTWLMMMGLFTPIIYLPTYAIEHGMNKTLASNLVAILNGASFFGRVIPGITADKIGRINVIAVSGTISGLLIFCWQACETNASIIVYTAIYGFWSGAIVSMATTCIAQTADTPKHIGTYLGQGMAVISIAALIGPPINGALVSNYHSFNQAADFSGVFTITGGILVYFSKLAFGKSLMSRF